MKNGYFLPLYRPERSYLLVFSARDDLVKVSWKSDARKCQNQLTPSFVWELLPSAHLPNSDSGFKMKAELQKFLKLYEELEEAGETASLTLMTKGGKSTIMLQLESSPSLPSTST